MRFTEQERSQYHRELLARLENAQDRIICAALGESQYDRRTFVVDLKDFDAEAERIKAFHKAFGDATLEGGSEQELRKRRRGLENLYALKVEEPTRHAYSPIQARNTLTR